MRNFFSFKFDRFLIIALFLIFIQQLAIMTLRPQFDPDQKNNAVCGLACEYNERFREAAFFFYHFGEFPVFPETPMTEFNKDKILNDVKEGKNVLLNESGISYRVGDHGKVFLYFPDLLFSNEGKGAAPSLRLFAIILFNLSLILLFFNLYFAGYRYFALALTLVISNSEAILFQVYNENNIFWLGPCAFMVGVSMLCVANRMKKSAWYFPVLLGAVFGFFSAVIREFRAEPFFVALLIWLLVAGLKVPFRNKLKFFGAGALTFVLLNFGFGIYWDYKLAQAKVFVSKNGGYEMPAKATIQKYHEFWHPIWCGLGDFDTKYGFEWNDFAAYGKIIPEMKEKYGISVDWPGGKFLNQYWDYEKKYPVKIGEYPEYHEIAKRQVLDSISRDPVWYLTILGKRLIQIGKDVTDISFEMAGYRVIAFSFNGILLIVLLVLVSIFYSKRHGRRMLDRFQILVLISSFSLSISALVVTTADGNAYSSIYHLVAFAMLFSWFDVKKDASSRIH